MTTLVRKLLRDVRVAVVVVGLLLIAFQILWAIVSKRVATEILVELTRFPGISVEAIRGIVFRGPGKIISQLIGGSMIRLERVQDMLSVAYVHPLTQTILCIWAVGRASSAIAGEIDRGTMELLMAQPLPRSRVVLANLVVDLLTIPLLCLCMWGGTWLGAWLSGLLNGAESVNLQVDPWRFGVAQLPVGLLMFAVSGATMWLSSLGRSRGRVLGLAILITLLQFLVNLIGQLWAPFEPLRPFTVFYYYQPQPIILNADWLADGSNCGNLLVLLMTGVVGYGLALWTFCRRDLPAPL